MFYITKLTQTACKRVYLSNLLGTFLIGCFSVADTFASETCFVHLLYPTIRCIFFVSYLILIFNSIENSTYSLWQQPMLNPIHCQRLRHFLRRPMPNSFVTFGFRIAWMYLVDFEVMIMTSISLANYSLGSPLLLHFLPAHINYQYFHSFFFVSSPKSGDFHCCCFWGCFTSQFHIKMVPTKWYQMEWNGGGRQTLR